MLIETIDLMVGKYESARIVNPSYDGLIAIEFFNSGEKQLKFYDLNSHEFRDFSYKYGPEDPLICAYVLNKS